jgi:GxxExxY protein
MQPQRARSHTEDFGINKITQTIIGSAMKVHTAMGPGLLESAYEACLVHELIKSGLRVQTQVILPIEYDGVKLDAGYRIDLLVNDLVIVELKCVDCFTDIHIAQILSYLKLSKKNVGLLLNFHVKHLKDGIKRVVSGTDWNP